MRSVKLLAIGCLLVSLLQPPIDGAEEQPLLSNIRQVTLTGRRAGEGYFSSDGAKMVFQSEREPGNPFYQIYLMNLRTGDTKRVSPGTGKTTCAWIHPSKEKLLFSSTHLDLAALEKQKTELEERESGESRRYSWDYDEHYDIFVADYNGSVLERLTDWPGYDAEASWSPDGGKILFASNRHAYSGDLSQEERKKLRMDPSYFMDLYMMDSDGENLLRLTEAVGYDGGPFFSADGSKICWRRFSPDGATAEIWTMEVDGTNPVQITRLGAMSWAPFFHPSGDYLIFTTNLHGFDNFELYLVDVEGDSEPVRVTESEGFDGLPVFLPDGNRLSWTSNRTVNNTSQIFFADWDDSLARERLGIGPNRDSAFEESESGEHPTASKNRDLSLDGIDEQDLRQHVEYLASEELEGRLTGTQGERLATLYVGSVFKSLGLSPGGDENGYYQEFPFTAGVSLGEDNEFALSQPDRGSNETLSLKVDEDWRPLAFTTAGDFPLSGIVFAGYGIVAPSEGEFGEYDSFAHLDVKNKWALVFRYMPEDIPAERRQHLNRFSSLRHKAMVLRGKGARGVIFVSGPNSKVKQELISLNPDASLSGSGIGAISITDSLAQRILDPAGKNLGELQSSLDSGEPMLGFEIPDSTIAVRIDLETEDRKGRNVLAYLPAGEGEPKSMVAIGAHIDHLGRGIGVGSLARDREEGLVHPGADDNASGVAALLEVAERLTTLKEKGALNQRRDLLFAAWSGEEMGLLGSNHFVKQLAQEVESTTNIQPLVGSYLNLDMVGRLEDSLLIQGFGSSQDWASIVEKANVAIGIPISTADESYLPTDAMSFYLKGVPILSAFTGSHEEYHSPRDTPEKINYEGLADTARLFALIAIGLAERETPPVYSEMTKPENLGARAALRAYLGTIPDYSQEALTGVKLSGVSKGGPADQAGVKGGDVVVSLAGKKIENIYDYTFAIEALKIGEEAEMVVERNGERLTLSIVPASRE